jgi:DNA-binding transcriptional LysR family regulator
MSELSTSELRRLDLTLLLVFLGLVRHRKALDVAAELGLTQSAISQSLKRLRDIFGDELFLRRPHGMAPTATALALEAPVAAAVDALRGALGAARDFDAATATGLVSIAALDAEQAVLIPPLAARLRQLAPGLTPCRSCRWDAEPRWTPCQKAGPIWCWAFSGICPK